MKRKSASHHDTQKKSSTMTTSKKHHSLLPLHPGRGVRGETKAVDLAPASYAFDTTGSVTPINLIQAGTSFVNRIGRKIAMQSLYINGDIQPQGENSAQSYCRMVVVYDAQPNGALPAWSDIVKSYTQTLSTSSTVRDGVNLDNRVRFRILLDHRVIMPNFTATVGEGPCYPTATETQIQEYRRLNNIECQYKADSSPAVIGDIATGSLVMFTFGEQAAGQGFFFEGTVRLRFTDN